MLVAVLGVSAALLGSALPASATINPDGGIVVKTPERICGKTLYELVHAERTYFNVYNADGTCMTVDGSLSMGGIAVQPGAASGWKYPNISSGWQWGRNPCTGHTGACFTYPVLLSTVLRSYTPRSGMQTTPGTGAYNSSWDIWFDPTQRTNGQVTGTEVMIWLSHPGISVSGGRTWYTRIDGLEFKVNEWVAHHNGTSWKYVRYTAVRQLPRGVGGLWLNPFFQDAISHRVLNSAYYLTSIDAGFEIPVGNIRNAAHGMSMRYYALGGLPSSKG